MFRDLAKHHAALASKLTEAAAETTNATYAERLMDDAAVHAQVSLACSAVAPVQPLRVFHDKAAGK